MKQTRIVPSSSPVTTIVVSGKPHHYFYSEALGKCRAILITDDENLFYQESSKKAEKPLSKGDKLKILMECGERLHKRYWAFYAVYDALPENDRKSRNALFAKMEAVHRASNRVTAKIKELIL